jgi:uncharacterized protein YbbK (DUF523 family)
MLRPTREQVKKNVVILLIKMKVFPAPMKKEEKIVSSCPEMKIGTKKNRKRVSIYFFGVTGDVFNIHKELASETTEE